MSEFQEVCPNSRKCARIPGSVPADETARHQESNRNIHKDRSWSIVAGSGSEADSGAGSGSEAGPGAGSGTGSASGSEAGTEAGSGSDGDAGAGPA